MFRLRRSKDSELNVGPMTLAAANELLRACPWVHFTSGRRSWQSQAGAMATMPDYCGAVKATLTVEQRLDCLEARLENVNTKANVALGVGVVGVVTGVAGVIAAREAIHGLKALKAPQ
jgi:hypothetical protein